MKDKDFQVGDKVTICHPEFGKIETKVIAIKSGCYPIGYPIVTDYEEEFTNEGFYHESDRVPTLYHGWGLDIPEIKEKKPERYPWINIYKTKSGKVLGREWKNKEAALREIPNYKGWEYVDTIQLKPKKKELKEI